MPCPPPKDVIACVQRGLNRGAPMGGSKPTSLIIPTPKSSSAMPKKTCPGAGAKAKGHDAFDGKGKPRKFGNIMITSRPCRVPDVMLTAKDLERLKAEAQVVSVDTKLSEMAKKELENQLMDEEAERTRNYFKKIDDARKKKTEEKAPKEQVDDDKVKVLERSFLAKHEQEEEIKHVNRIILNAKCHAVRDAQLAEKAEKERLQKLEERRLENLVINRTQEGLKREDDEVEGQRQRNIQYAQAIRAQLQERENLRFLEAERIEEEAKVMREAHAAVMRDEARQAEMARERRRKFGAELAKIQEMTNVFKKMMCEQEQEMDRRIVAYMREKEARMKELRDAKILEKNALERKQQRIFILAQKFAESKSARDEMSFLREQEKVEREYRLREKEAALRKKQIEKEFEQARARQMEEQKNRRAVQLARDEQEFNVLLEHLKREEEKRRREEEERERQRSIYRKDVMRQINDNENARRRLLDFEKKQANAWRESERQREENIRAVIQAKLAAMREACLPAKYLGDVEKHLMKFMPKTKSDVC